MSIIHQRKEVKKTSFVWCHFLTNGQIWAIAAAARKEANQEVSPETKSEIFSKSFQHQSVLDPSHKCFNLSLFSWEGERNSSSSSEDRTCAASLNDRTLYPVGTSLDIFFVTPFFSPCLFPSFPLFYPLLLLTCVGNV